MSWQDTKTSLGVAIILLLCTVPLTAQKHPEKKAPANSSALPEVLWHDPGNIASLDLFYGAGGKVAAPDPNATFTFVEEDMDGTSPKFNVEDDHGVKWKVKLGRETQSETAATRLLWAAGYFVDEDYYVSELKVAGLPKLRRGEEFVSGGIVHHARLERHVKGVKKLGKWDWFKNPFAGHRELNGLRVMMALMNNWDLHGYNNEIYETESERIYLISDVGATFGQGGTNFSRNKSVLRDYQNSEFIEKTTPDEVDFAMKSHLFLIYVFRFGKPSPLEAVTRNIPRADARWVGDRLAQLSDAQIRDAFRAAGYTPQEIDGYAKVVEKRIAELKAL
jgi:hypothetical protein